MHGATLACLAVGIGYGFLIGLLCGIVIGVAFAIRLGSDVDGAEFGAP